MRLRPGVAERARPRIAPMRVVGLAALVAAGVAACAFAVQWAALPDAGNGNVAAARAAVWLGRYRETRAELTLGGRRLGATCYHGWIDGRRGRDRRGTALLLSNGDAIRALPPHSLLFTGIKPARPVAALEAAGCTKVLGDRLAELAQFAGTVRARRTRFDGTPALAVAFPHLTLYVARRTDIPVGVDTFRIAGRFRFVRPSPRAGAS